MKDNFWIFILIIAVVLAYSGGLFSILIEPHQVYEGDTSLVRGGCEKSTGCVGKLQNDIGQPNAGKIVLARNFEGTIIVNSPDGRTATYGPSKLKYTNVGDMWLYRDVQNVWYKAGTWKITWEIQNINTGNSVWIETTNLVVKSAEEPEPDETEPEGDSCDCSEWTADECVSDTKRAYTRSCTPTLCAEEEETRYDTSCESEETEEEIVWWIDGKSCVEANKDDMGEDDYWFYSKDKCREALNKLVKIDGDGNGDTENGNGENGDDEGRLDTGQMLIIVVAVSALLFLLSRRRY